MATNEATLDAVRSTNWAGSIPVVLSLAPSSLSSPTMPNPIHSLVPRQSHLHVALKSAVGRLHKFAPAVISLSSHTSAQSLVQNEPNEGAQTQTKDSMVEDAEIQTPTECGATITPITKPNVNYRKEHEQLQVLYPTCWFEDLDTRNPLRWHLFAGVLWDLKTEPKCLPWNLRIHFTQYPPASQILPLETDPWTSVERVLKNSLKQALFLRYGSAKVAMNLSKQSMEQISDSILAVNYKLYQHVNEEQLLQRGSSTLQSAKLLPVRLMIDSKPPIQKPCNTDDTSMATLGGLLSAWAPSMFTEYQESVSISDNTIIHLAPPTANLTIQWTIQGLRNIPLTANLNDLWQALCHPDHFLYILVTTASNQ